jgi:hypothetical protein
VKEPIVNKIEAKESTANPNEVPSSVPYQRIGKCSRCHADVYAPEDSENGKWPMMSACDCGSGPKVIRPSTPSVSKKRGEEPKAVAAAGGAGGSYEG